MRSVTWLRRRWRSPNLNPDKTETQGVEDSQLCLEKAIQDVKRMKGVLRQARDAIQRQQVKIKAVEDSRA